MSNITLSFKDVRPGAKFWQNDRPRIKTEDLRRIYWPFLSYNTATEMPIEMADGVNSGWHKDSDLQLINCIDSDGYGYEVDDKDQVQIASLDDRLPLTLGQLIDGLKAVKQDNVVYFNTDGDISKSPGDPDSYRGYYNCLAFDFTGHKVLVSDFLMACETCVGQSFMGYKGGHFEMNENTGVYASGYGLCSGLRIVEVEQSDDCVYLNTREE